MEITALSPLGAYFPLPNYLTKSITTYFEHANFSTFSFTYFTSTRVIKIKGYDYLYNTYIRYYEIRIPWKEKMVERETICVPPDSKSAKS